MLNWPPKDPDEVLDYRWRPSIDSGDTLASAVLTLESGTVVVDRQSQDGTGVTIWLSGGELGNVLFRGLATTAAGRTYEEYILIPITSKQTPVAPMIAGMTPAEQLLDAKTKYHMLVTGQAARVVFDGNSGDRVEYTAATSGLLLAYIRMLEPGFLMAPTAARITRPIGFIF